MRVQHIRHICDLQKPNMEEHAEKLSSVTPNTEEIQEEKKKKKIPWSTSSSFGWQDNTANAATVMTTVRIESLVRSALTPPTLGDC